MAVMVDTCVLASFFCSFVTASRMAICVLADDANISQESRRVKGVSHLVKIHEKLAILDGRVSNRYSRHVTRERSEDRVWRQRLQEWQTLGPIS